MPCGPEIGRDVAHAGLERRLGDAHDIVVRHDPGRAAIGEREKRAAVLHALAARWAISVKEKQEITMVREKFSRVVTST